VERAAREIIVRHYLTDNTPAHEARGRTPEAIYLALIREGLVSQLSHAAYLGAELAKAEASLRLGARYEQDRPLRPETPPPAAPAPEASTPAPPMPAIPVALTWEELSALTAGDAVNVVISVTGQPSEQQFAGTLTEPEAEDPFHNFRRTEHLVQVHWGPDTRVAMGKASDVEPGAIVRARGVLGPDRAVQAEAVIILTSVATIA